MRENRFGRIMVLILFAVACRSGGIPTAPPTESFVEPPTSTPTAPGAATLESADSDRPSTATLTPSPSPTVTATPVLDLFAALQDGTISVFGTNGAGGFGDHVDLLIQNQTDAAIQVESPAGLVVGDDDPATIDLVLPPIMKIDVPPGSEINVSIPAYQAAFTYPDRFPGPDVEMDVGYFINPAPEPGASLAILEMNTRLGAVLEAADTGELPVINLAAQLAVLAIASDIRAGGVGLCGSVLVYRGTILRGDTIFRFTCINYSIGLGASTEDPGDFGVSKEVVGEARDILRKSAGLNAELATPFRIAIQSASKALADEQVRSALVALVDQDRLVELFGFGATFHLVGSGQLPEGGVASLPEISSGGMSQSDALAVIQAWNDTNGPLEFDLMIEEGDPMVLLAQLVSDGWYSAGASTQIIVEEVGTFYQDFFTGNFDDTALEHRPGLLP